MPLLYGPSLPPSPSFMYSWFIELLFLLHSHPKTSFSLFWTERAYFEAKIDNRIQSTEILILDLFCFAHYDYPQK